MVVRCGCGAADRGGWEAGGGRSGRPALEPGPGGRGHRDSGGGEGAGAGAGHRDRRPGQGREGRGGGVGGRVDAGRFHCRGLVGGLSQGSRRGYGQETVPGAVPGGVLHRGR
ncbi:hypothetical protein FVA95_25250 [Pseudonocardia sp. EV170527-09]|nr:hypothetical protein FVA95_25250 [Pseudonocardia sp. EV170527-09]